MKKSRILALVLAGTLLFSTPVFAMENDSPIKKNNPIENLDTYASKINKDDAYEKIEQSTGNMKEYKPNNMERSNGGEKFEIMHIWLRTKILCKKI